MSIAIKDAAGSLVNLRSTEVSGEQVPHHVVHQSVLPAGASTEATLAAILAVLGTSGTKVLTSALPAGAATQTTLAAILAAMGTPALPTGAATQATLAGVLAALNLLPKLTDMATVLQYTPASLAYYTSGDISDTSDHQILAAPTNPLKACVAQFTASNSNASTGSYISLLADTTVAYSVYVAPKTAVSVTFPLGAPFQIAAATKLQWKCETAINARVSAVYFTQN